jgi:hypothetical protein
MMLVDGPAGCGKTWLAVQKVRRLVEDGTLAEGQRILCVSFSLAARTRMVQILAEHVPDYRDKVLVMTFDSLALALVLGLSGTPAEEATEDELGLYMAGAKRNTPTSQGGQN